MQTSAIGMDEIKTYEITIPGEDPHRFDGTQQQMWEHVSARMAKAGATEVPKIEVVGESEGTPAVDTSEPATSEPATDNEGEGEETDTERSTMDLLAAQAAGFSPARPYFDRGTPVVDLGVQNARQSRREHDALPTVSQAVETFVQHVKAEERRDELTQITSLAMTDEGLLMGGKGGPWTVEPGALTQLASRMGIENPAYLTTAWPALRALNWNHWLATAVGHERSTCPEHHAARKRLEGVDEKHVYARLRKNADRAEPSAWAFVSDRYGILDVDALATSLKAGMQAYPDARCEIEYDGHRAQMDVLFHSDVQPERYVAGEFFKAGIRVRTSDSGGGSISVGMLLYQNLCLNLIMIDVAEFSLAKIRHIGDPEVLAKRFAAAVEQGQERLQYFLKRWNVACDETLVNAQGRPDHLRLLDELPERALSETEVLTGIFKGITKSGAVSLNKNDLPGLLLSHSKDASGAVQAAPITRASVVNAITRHAHETVGLTDPLRQQELEREAGALLVSARGKDPMPLAFMPPAGEPVTA